MGLMLGLSFQECSLNPTRKPGEQAGAASATGTPNPFHGPVLTLVELMKPLVPSLILATSEEQKLIASESQ